MVSTGILKYDKRGEPGNLVNCLNLKNKRQQYCCYGCLSFTPFGCKAWQCRDLRVTRSSDEYRGFGLSVKWTVNMHRSFALEPIMQKRATEWGSVSVHAPWREFEITDCPRRRLYGWVFGQEFDSPHLHQTCIGRTLTFSAAASPWRFRSNTNKKRHLRLKSKVAFFVMIICYWKFTQ